MFGWSEKLRTAGVLGLNERNANYVLRCNERHLYPLVDDKLRTKRLALEAGIAVPDLYGVVASHHDVRRLREIVESHRDFVIKPAHGSGGDGIFVVSGRSARKFGVFRLIDGTYINDDEIRHHVSNIISGQYSLGGTRDCALIEYRVRSDPVFQAVSYQGVPDVRVLVYQGFPVMSMVRLPTRRSRGKANLHQGAVGVGIDIATGRCRSGVFGNDVIFEHPDTGEPFKDLEIPQWQVFLDLAARSHSLTGLGYLGVDIVLDADLGPLILELNARPGLNIQIANRTGLRRRLDAIDSLATDIPAGDRSRAVRELFA